jgi:hypothetical protein
LRRGCLLALLSNPSICVNIPYNSNVIQVFQEVVYAACMQRGFHRSRPDRGERPDSSYINMRFCTERIDGITPAGHERDVGSDAAVEDGWSFSSIPGTRRARRSSSLRILSQ